jgi:hypothetical protein
MGDDRAMQNTEEIFTDTSETEEILERLEDVEDLQMLARMRVKPLSFSKLDSFLKEFSSGV